MDLVVTKARDLSDCVMHIFMRDSGVGMSIGEQKKYVSLMHIIRFFYNIFHSEHSKLLLVPLKMVLVYHCYIYKFIIIIISYLFQLFDYRRRWFI